MVNNKNTLMPINVKKLNFEKGYRKLLTDISCEIKAKGITIILGPNGAGKTLFLKYLHGLISDSTSEITFANKTLNTTIRKQQSMVFQSPILLRRSVFKNISFALKQRTKIIVIPFALISQEISVSNFLCPFLKFSFFTFIGIKVFFLFTIISIL